VMRGNWPVNAAARVSVSASLMTLSSPMAFAPFEFGFVDCFAFRRVGRFPRLVDQHLALALQNHLRVCLMPFDDLADGKSGPRRSTSWTEFLGIELFGDVLKRHLIPGPFKNESKGLELLRMGHKATALVLETVRRVPPNLARTPLCRSLNSFARGSQGNTSADQDVANASPRDSGDSGNLGQGVSRFIFWDDLRDNPLLREFRNANQIVGMANSGYCNERDPKISLF
jgi:hypothetical protein